MSWRSYYGFRPYVPVAQRRRNAQREASRLAKKGTILQPVQIEGRAIARTFWGKAWCDHLESYMDYANRLPRGRTYVRNGSVIHLDIAPGSIEAMVSGSELYKIDIKIGAAAKARWQTLCQQCAGGIGSLVELLQGRFSDHVMGILSRKETGLFPEPKEIKLSCSCPDWATLCKHVAAVLYGVGARLDQSPELLFTLRSVNHEELITRATDTTALTGRQDATGPVLDERDLGDVFGIELDTPAAPSQAPDLDAARKPAPARAVAAPAPAKTRKVPPARRASAATRASKGAGNNGARRASSPGRASARSAKANAASKRRGAAAAAARGSVVKKRHPAARSTTIKS